MKSLYEPDPVLDEVDPARAAPAGARHAALARVEPEHAEPEHAEPMRTESVRADLEAELQIEERDAKGRRRRVWVGATLAGLLATGLIAFAWLTRSNSGGIRYTTQPVTRGDLIVTVTATGTLQPTNQVEIGSEISGTIKTVDADYNDTVKIGQVLARLDTSRLAAQVAQSRAALAAAQAKVLQADATVAESEAQLARLQRMRALTNDTVPSQSDIDTALAARDRARADAASARALVQQSQATLDAQRTDLDKTVIRSPINGIVLKRSVEPGQTVAATLQAPVLFVLAEDLTQMELDVDVDEADVSSVRTGQRATFTVDAYPDRKFDAAVSEVHYGAQTVSGVVTYQTVLTVDNSGLELRPGMTATAEMIVKEVRDALLVPNSALRFAPADQGTRTQSTSSGGFMTRLMPRLPRPQPHRAPAQTGMRQIWTLQNGVPAALSVRTGATDGTHTQIVAGDVQPGTPLIVDALSGGK